MDNSKVLQVPIEDIIPNRFQPRLAFDESSLQELANSIKEHGIIQPLVLRRVADKYEIIAGERRYKASMLAGLTSVPAIITEMDDNTSAEVAIVENVQRKDLTAIEEARSYQALLDKGYMTQEELAKKMGLSQAAISNKLRLLNLDETVQDAVLNEKISERHARSLLKIKDVNEQKKMLSRIINERLTVRQLEEEIKKLNINEVEDMEQEVINNNEVRTEENTTQDSTDTTTTDETTDATGNKPAIESASQVNPGKRPFGNIFSNPEQIPSKFFNFLEDEAVNMSMETEPSAPSININPEVTPVETPQVEAPIENKEMPVEEEIEMLDFDTIPTPPNAPSNSYVETVKDQIHSLNLDLTKVRIEENDTPLEYVITIKINKN